MEGKFPLSSGQGGVVEGGYPGNPNLYHECFSTTKNPCGDINSMMAKFWWGHKQNDKRIAWMSWTKLGRAKTMGGMGY